MSNKSNQPSQIRQGITPQDGELIRNGSMEEPKKSDTFKLKPEYRKRFLEPEQGLIWQFQYIIGTPTHRGKALLFRPYEEGIVTSHVLEVPLKFLMPI